MEAMSELESRDNISGVSRPDNVAGQRHPRSTDLARI